MSEQKIVTELKVSGHLMKLDPGIYCVFHAANGHGPNPSTGLPGVRISLPPGASENGSGVEISGFRNDGWVSSGHDAALIRVSDSPAQVLVTVYQSSLGGDALPQLQVVRLGDIRPGATPNAIEQRPPPASAPPRVPKSAPPPALVSAPAQPVVTPEALDLSVTAHIQRRGDVQGSLGEWIGERGSKLWIEGFSMIPPSELRPEDVEYQAVLGRGWLSPWSQGGQFCGSRRMALPVLGLRIRLRGSAATAFECAYSASFTDGSMVGPVAAGEACEADNLAPLEAFQVILRPRPAAASPAPGPTSAAVVPITAHAVAAHPQVGRLGQRSSPSPGSVRRSEKSVGKALPRRR